MAGKVVVSTLNNDTGVLATQNGMTGIAKAWVNFNGTGTVAIRDSFNVSSITDNGTGDYTINFTTAMPNANYAFAGSGVNDAINTNIVTSNPATARTTTALRITVCLPNNSVGDAAIVNVVVFSS
jgi:hypothetical protein